MVVSYPSRPGIFQTDPFASFQQGYSFTKGIRNERDGIDAFGQYADTLYGPKTNEPQPSLAALGQVFGEGNPAFNGASAEVPQTALAAADAIGAGTTQPINAYTASVRGAESGGNNLARNPRSTATGPYQFLEGTWNDLARKYPDLGLTPDGRTDPAQNERAMQAFTRENARMLAGEGIPVNPGNLYAAHFLGAGGASNVLKQPDTGLIASYLPPEVVAANPHLQGMTVGDFRQWAGKQGGGPSGGYAAPQMAGIANGGFPSPRPVEQRSVLPPRDVMMALFRSPETRQLAISLAQAAQSGQPIEQFQTFQREDGSVWQMNTQTGEMGLLQDAPKVATPDLPSSVREYEYARANGFTGSFADWQKSNKAGTTVNVGSDVGTIPQGYELFTDPASGARRLQPIAGGPVEQELQAAADAKAAGNQQKGTYSDIVTEDIDRALGILEADPTWTTGLLGEAMRHLKGSGADRLDNLLTTVRANASFDRLQAMRAASPTGGALGAVSDKELKMLQNAIGSLEASNADDLAFNLRRVQKIYSDIVNGPGDGQAGSPDYSEGTIIENEQGQRMVLRDGDWVAL